MLGLVAEKKTKNTHQIFQETLNWERTVESELSSKLQERSGTSTKNKLDTNQENNCKQ